MNQSINIIIICDQNDCRFCNEGECGKDILYCNDKECLKLNKERGQKNE